MNRKERDLIGFDEYNIFRNILRAFHFPELSTLSKPTLATNTFIGR